MAIHAERHERRLGDHSLVRIRMAFGARDLFRDMWVVGKLALFREEIHAIIDRVVGALVAKVTRLLGGIINIKLVAHAAQVVRGKLHAAILLLVTGVTINALLDVDRMNEFETVIGWSGCEWRIGNTRADKDAQSHGNCNTSYPGISCHAMPLPFTC